MNTEVSQLLRSKTLELFVLIKSFSNKLRSKLTVES